MSRRLALAVALTLGARGVPAAGADEGRPAAPAVVVELFTSQGCSSCPPADRLLARLAAESGGRVVALAFHIDGWNSPAWTDPFSSAAWSRRQEAYGRALRVDHLYTPQAVVAGRVEALGSDEALLRRAIAAAGAEVAARIDLELARRPGKVVATAVAEVPSELGDRKLDLMLAVVETGLVTPVRGGENGGRELRDDYVVRDLRRIGRVGRGEATARATAEVTLDRSWDPGHLGVAVFVQDPRSLAILGAAARELPATGDGGGGR